MHLVFDGWVFPSSLSYQRSFQVQIHPITPNPNSCIAIANDAPSYIYIEKAWLPSMLVLEYWLLNITFPLAFHNLHQMLDVILSS